MKRFREHGLRITPRRAAILRVLAKSEGHPTAEQVHRVIAPEFPMTSLASVYKIIHVLKELVEIQELEFSDMGNRYDGAKPYPHPHVIREGCGVIQDFEELEADRLIQRIEARTGFAVTNHRLDFYGLCAACLKREEKS